MEENKKYWENRAKKYKTDIRGVLFKKPYPSFVNTWFHRWSLAEVRKIIEHNKKFSVLDIACGWGRVSQALADEYPDIDLNGIDVSAPYVRIYNKMLKSRGSAVIASMHKIPHKDHKFDAAFLIVSLMYLTKKETQQQAVSEINRVVKTGGKILIIERTKLMVISDIFSNIGALLKGKYKEQISFTRQQIHDLMKGTKGQIVKENSWPLPILPLYRSYIIINK